MCSFGATPCSLVLTLVIPGCLLASAVTHAWWWSDGCA